MGVVTTVTLWDPLETKNKIVMEIRDNQDVGSLQKL